MTSMDVISFQAGLEAKLRADNPDADQNRIYAHAYGLCAALIAGFMRGGHEADCCRERVMGLINSNAAE